MFAILPVGRLQKKRKYDKMGNTIMIVDDEHPFHELYMAMLEGTDYGFIHVYDGEEALAWASAARELGLHRGNLYHLARRLGLTRP